jgi:hypothetical protein
LYEIGKFLSAEPQIKEYGTHLTISEHPQGISYDKIHRRLLVAVEGVEEASEPYKEIYAFDLKSRKMIVKPAIRINLNDTLLNPATSKKLQQLLQPSDITMHPVSGRIFICDATKSQLVVISPRGTVRSIVGLPRELIIQPEGIRITPSGELYIVSGGTKEVPGKLLLVQMPRN